MKKFALLVVALSAIFVSCQNGGTNSVSSSQQIDSLSTAFGKLMAYSMKQMKGVTINEDVYLKSFKATLAQKEVPMNEIEEASAYIQNYMNIVLPEQLKKAQAEYIAELEKKGISKTESGLFYEIINEGDANNKPKAEDKVTVNYKGTLVDGTEFDSSYKRNEPATFPLNGVIKGWTEGLQLIGKGGKMKLYIPSDLAYGSSGELGNQLLVFEVELLEVNPEAKDEK